MQWIVAQRGITLHVLFRVVDIRVAADQAVLGCQMRRDFDVEFVGVERKRRRVHKQVGAVVRGREQRFEE